MSIMERGFPLLGHKAFSSLDFSKSPFLLQQFLRDRITIFREETALFVIDIEGRTRAIEITEAFA